MTEEEIELVRRSIRGDPEAFGLLYGRSWKTVYAFILSHVADWDEARSIAQESFLQAWKGVGRLREPGRFGGWIRTVAMNEVKKWRGLADTRARARRAPMEAIGDPADARAPDPAESLSRAEFEAAVREALDDLPPLAREAALLRILADLDCGEIAERLGIGYDQAKGLAARGVARAAKRLRRRVAGGGAP